MFCIHHLFDLHGEPDNGKWQCQHCVKNNLFWGKHEVIILSHWRNRSALRIDHSKPPSPFYVLNLHQLLNHQYISDLDWHRHQYRQNFHSLTLML
ncbi:hypothetical protein Xekk_03279 [Xenorhabdus sp. KK7.4]|nr:hypothetical protein Xekk_03279 [Xenorhabdus sp. KK7.4]